MKVVAIKSHWIVSIKRNFAPYELPQEGEIYEVVFVEHEGNDTYYCLRELPGGVFNSKGFRHIDDSFGEWVEETLIKELEYQEVCQS